MDVDLRYTRLQIYLHWAVAALIAAQIAFCGAVEKAFEKGEETGHLDLTGGVALHFAIGAIILVLVFLRLVLRKEHAAPRHATGAARLIYPAIYAVLLLMPVTGAMTWGMESPRAAAIHQTLIKVLVVLVLIHIGIAVHGQFVRKTGVFRLMTWPRDDRR